MKIKEFTRERKTSVETEREMWRKDTMGERMLQQAAQPQQQ